MFLLRDRYFSSEPHRCWPPLISFISDITFRFITQSLPLHWLSHLSITPIDWWLITLKPDITPLSHHEPMLPPAPPLRRLISPSQLSPPAEIAGFRFDAIDVISLAFSVWDVFLSLLDRLGLQKDTEIMPQNSQADRVSRGPAIDAGFHEPASDTFSQPFLLQVIWCLLSASCFLFSSTSSRSM